MSLSKSIPMMGNPGIRLIAMADQAYEENDRERCCKLIAHVYEYYDHTAPAREATPDATILRVRSAEVDREEDDFFACARTPGPAFLL